MHLWSRSWKLCVSLKWVHESPCEGELILNQLEDDVRKPFPLQFTMEWDLSWLTIPITVYTLQTPIIMLRTAALIFKSQNI